MPKMLLVHSKRRGEHTALGHSRRYWSLRGSLLERIGSFAEVEGWWRIYTKVPLEYLEQRHIGEGSANILQGLNLIEGVQCGVIFDARHDLLHARRHELEHANVACEIFASSEVCP